MAGAREGRGGGLAPKRVEEEEEEEAKAESEERGGSKWVRGGWQVPRLPGFLQRGR